MPGKYGPGSRHRRKCAQGEPTAASGEPISAYPNWDPVRKVLVVHSDRDPGSDYGDVQTSHAAEPPANEPVGARRDEVLDYRDTQSPERRNPRGHRHWR